MFRNPIAKTDVKVASIKRPFKHQHPLFCLAAPKAGQIKVKLAVVRRSEEATSISRAVKQGRWKAGRFKMA